MSERKEDHYIRNFYIRRYFRIAPLYYLGIFIYLIVANVPALNLGGPLAHEKAYTPINVLLNVFFVHGFFQKAYNSIVPGGWSIGSEMLFYLAFPLIFAFYTKIKNAKLLYFLPIVALLVANVYMYVIYMVVKDKVYTIHFFYAFIINQLPIFLVGISYFFLEKFGKIKISASLSAIAFLAIFSISYVLTIPTKHNITLPIFIAAISFSFLFNFFKQKNFELYILHRIGQLSFSIYIFHFLFAYPVAYKISQLLADSLNPYLIFTIKFIMALVFSVIVAIASEKFIEKPGIKIGKNLIKRLNKRATAK
jgi:peptidoglycan/LPS O-acetylase OafA/YrhL